MNVENMILVPQRLIVVKSVRCAGFFVYGAKHQNNKTDKAIVKHCKLNKRLILI